MYFPIEILKMIITFMLESFHEEICVQIWSSWRCCSKFWNKSLLENREFIYKHHLNLIYQSIINDSSDFQYFLEL